MESARRQSGLSMLWFMFVLVVMLVVAVVGFRVLPAYIEYFSVEKALNEALKDVQNPQNSNDVRNRFQRKADAGYIESVGGRNIEMERVGNEYIATVDWTRKLPLVGNASLLLEFHVQAKR
jgi:hypothetical protein